MPLQKSASLPAILALGTSPVKLEGHEKQQSLRYLNADKRSAYATFKAPHVSPQILDYAAWSAHIYVIHVYTILDTTYT